MNKVHVALPGGGSFAAQWLFAYLASGCQSKNATEALLQVMAVEGATPLAMLLERAMHMGVEPQAIALMTDGLDAFTQAEMLVDRCRLRRHVK